MVKHSTMLTMNLHAEESAIFRLPYSGREMTLSSLRREHPLFVEEMDGSLQDTCFSYFYDRNPITGVYEFRNDESEDVVADLLGIDLIACEDNEIADDKWVKQGERAKSTDREPRKKNTNDNLYALPCSTLLVTKRHLLKKYPQLTCDKMNVDQTLELFYVPQPAKGRIHRFRDGKAENDVAELLGNTTQSNESVEPVSTEKVLFLSICTTGKPVILRGKWPDSEDTGKYDSARLIKLAWQLCQRRPNGDYIAVQEDQTRITTTESLKEALSRLLSVAVVSQELVAHDVDFVRSILVSECVRTTQHQLYAVLRASAWTCTQKTIGKYLGNKIGRRGLSLNEMKNILLPMSTYTSENQALDSCEDLVQCINVFSRAKTEE